MRPLRLLLVTLFAFLVCTPAFGQDFGDLSTAADIVHGVEQVYGQAECLQADFTQVSRSAALGDEQRQKGKVAVKRPRKMRWEFTSPDKKLFVTDGQTMWIWSPSDNQVIVYKDFSGGSSDVTGLLSDLSKINELFEVTLVPSEGVGQSYVLDLKPRSADAGNFKQLQITFSRRKLLVERVVLTDQFDNLTDLTFSQVKLDAKVPDGDFTFEVPAGAQVITPEGM
ncbi:MAG: outer membrane lipoprotein carrier protein LolA [Pseudomonadota bacterium]